MYWNCERSQKTVWLFIETAVTLCGDVATIEESIPGFDRGCSLSPIRRRQPNTPPTRHNTKQIHQVPAVVAMLHGHASAGKKLLQAFSAAKTACKRSRTIDAFAAVAMASGVTHAVEPVADAADKDENRR